MLWLLLVIVLIVLIVSISRGNKKKNLEIVKLQNEVNQPKSDNSIADELAKLKSLLDSGVISEEEFRLQKEKLLK